MGFLYWYFSLKAFGLPGCSHRGQGDLPVHRWDQVSPPLETFWQAPMASNEYSGLISFRMDWLDLLAVQGTLKSLLQQHSSKAPIICCSDLFIVYLSHSYMTTGKTIALTRWTFVGKVMSLLLNMLSRLVIAFLPGESVFWFHGCNHYLQWFLSPPE